MASKYDSIRNRYGSSGSRYDAIRNRSVDEPPELDRGIQSTLNKTFMNNAMNPGVNLPKSLPTEEVKPKKSILQKVGQALADFPNAFNSSTSFGLTDAVGRLTGQETKEEQIARDSRIGGKIGNIAGYVAPGAAIDQLVVRSGGAALKSLPKVAQGLIRGTAAGTLDAAAQEAGDVAFRGREFDPLNIAIGGAAGGALGVAAPLAKPLVTKAGKGLKSLVRGVGELGDVATGGLKSGIKAGAKQTESASPTLKHIVSSTKKEIPSVKGAMDKGYIDTVDDLFALKRADDIASQAKGRALNPTESAHELAMQSRGSAQMARQILTDKMVDTSGNVVGEGLKDVLTQVGRKNIRQFEDYLINRHAITRFARGEKVFPDSMKWTPEVGKSIVESYEKKFPQFKEAAQNLTQFQDNLNNLWRVDSGLLKPEVVASWKAENPDYINMNRFFSDLEKTGNGVRAKRGLAGQKDPTKGYSKGGSQRKIIRPIESIIKNVDATVKVANMTRSMQAMVRNIQEHPDVFEGIARIVPDHPQIDSFKNIDLSTPDGIDEMISRLDDTFNKAMKSTRKDLDNVVPVMVRGEPVYLEIQNKNLLEAVASINPEVFDSATKFASAITNTWKAMLTGINPIFTLTRSIFRDPVSAYVQSKSTNNPLRFVSDLVQGAWAVMRDKDLYKEYKRLGGGYNSPNIGTPKLLNRTVREILPSDKVMQGVVQRFGDKLGEVLNKIETVPRIGEYKRLRGSGSIDEKLKALSESREVAVNFQRRGRIGRSVDAFFPYFNAAVQSLDKLGRAIKDQPGAVVTKAGLSVTIPSILLYLKNSNNPNYQKLSDSEKDRFLHIPMGDGKFFRYPLPQELIPFAAIPRRLLQQINDKDPEAWNDFGNTMIQNFLPPGAAGAVSGFNTGGLPGAAIGAGQDTFAGPLVDVSFNKTWTGSPIVPGHLQDASPKNQFDARTSNLAKRISELTSGSPMQLDYLIRQYGGDLGNIATGIADKGIVKAGQGTLEGVGKRLVVDSTMSDRALNDFYKLKDKYDRMYADIKASGEVPKGYNDDVRLQLNRIASGLSDFTKAMREIDKSNLSDQEKKKQKRELTEMRNEIARQAYTELK